MQTISNRDRGVLVKTGNSSVFGYLGSVPVWDTFSDDARKTFSLTTYTVVSSFNPLDRLEICNNVRRYFGHLKSGQLRDLI